VNGAARVCLAYAMAAMPVILGTSATLATSGRAYAALPEASLRDRSVDPAQILLVVALPDALDVRLLAELETAHFAVTRTMLRSGTADSPAELAEVARGTQSQWLVHLRADRIDVWSVRGAVLTFIEAFARGAEDDVAVVRVSERLRIAVLAPEPERALAAQISNASQAATTASAVASEGLNDVSDTRFRAAEHRLRVATGVGLLVIPQGRPVAVFRPELGASVSERLTLSAVGTIPLGQTTIDGTGGIAALRMYGVEGRVGYRIRTRGPVEPFLGIGGGAWLATAQGQTALPNRAEHGAAWAPTASAAAGLHVVLTRTLRVRAEASAATLLAPLRLQFIGNPVDIGPLLFSGSLALEAAFFEM
jgi:hypothetical protein